MGVTMQVRLNGNDNSGTVGAENDNSGMFGAEHESLGTVGDGE